MLISESGVRTDRYRNCKTHWAYREILNSRTSPPQEKLYLEEEIAATAVRADHWEKRPLKHILELVTPSLERIPRFCLAGRDRNGQGAHCAAIHDRGRSKDRTL